MGVTGVKIYATLLESNLATCIKHESNSCHLGVDGNEITLHRKEQRCSF